MSEQSRAERLWQQTVEHSPVGMALLGADGTLLNANQALRDMLGYSEAELDVLGLQGVTHPDDIDAGLAFVKEALAGRITSFRTAKRYLHADGSIVWGDLSAVLVRTDDGTPLHFISQVVDVTAARLDQERLARATEVIEQQSRQARAILDTVDVGLVLVDPDGGYELINRWHAEYTSLAYPDGHLGSADHPGLVFAADGTTLLSGEEMPTSRAARAEEFDDYRVWVGDDPLTRRALSASARSMRDQSGSFEGAVLAYHDITDLLQALRTQEEFVAAVSHELRSPLSSVLGHIELLLDSESLPEEVVHGLEVVKRNSVRLSRLVSDLLETTLQRDGSPVLVRSPIDVADLVREVVESAQPGARAGGIELYLDAPAAVFASVDPPRLRQVVDNLVSNAVKYTDSGGRVSVGVRADEQSVEITVVDTGIGVAPDDLDRLFTPFFRSRQARERQAPGAGLGLGISRAIVDAHGGILEVDSEPGRGSTFRATLPLALEPTLEPTLEPAQELAQEPAQEVAHQDDPGRWPENMAP